MRANRTNVDLATDLLANDEWVVDWGVVASVRSDLLDEGVEMPFEVLVSWTNAGCLETELAPTVVVEMDSWIESDVPPSLFLTEECSHQYVESEIVEDGEYLRLLQDQRSCGHNHSLFMYDKGISQIIKIIS